MTLWNATFHMCCSTFSIAQKRKSLANMIRKLFWKNFLLRNQSNKKKQKKMLKIPGPNLMRPTIVKCRHTNLFIWMRPNRWWRP
jgi:hypothetical protein